MIRTLLFATDFSPLSDRAEAYARDVAEAFGAKVEVMHAVAPVTADLARDPAMARLTRRLVRLAQKRLDAVVDRMKAAGLISQSYLAVAVPWEAVVEQAEAIGADLIIVGSHGLRSKGRIHVGTTSHRVLFNTKVPVLVVRPEERGA